MSSPISSGNMSTNAMPLCKHTQPWPQPVAEWAAGQSVTVKFHPGGAPHGGGHCQFSLSYDGGKTFVVVHEILETCLAGGSSDSGYQYSFALPPGVPASPTAVFSWTWVNAIGSREFYMNCADVAISGTSQSYTGKEMTILNYPGHPQIPEFMGNSKTGLEYYANAKTITVTSSRLSSLPPPYSRENANFVVSPAPVPSSSSSSSTPPASQSSASGASKSGVAETSQTSTADTSQSDADTDYIDDDTGNNTTIPYAETGDKDCNGGDASTSSVGPAPTQSKPGGARESCGAGQTIRCASGSTGYQQCVSGMWMAEMPCGPGTRCRESDDRVDFIHVGTAFPSAQEQQRGRKGTWDGKPREYSRDAFKGGFSAGYFGTVGSKEGWAPSAGFVSSRGRRAQAQQMRPEDFMDAEDLADLQAAQTLSVAREFGGAGAGARQPLLEDERAAAAAYGGVVGAVAERISAELGAISIHAETVGDRIMAAMGWKPGQGTGPLSRDAGRPASGTAGTASLLPPRPTPPASVAPWRGLHGVGYGVDLSTLAAEPEARAGGGAAPAVLFRRKPAATAAASKKGPKKQVDRQRLSFGMPDDDDDDDGDGALWPAAPQLRHVAPGLPAVPEARTAMAAGRAQCHDGRAPLAGFRLSEPIEPAVGQHSGPAVPSTYTGVRRAAASRWDSVPATGSESRLTAGADGGRPRLVTARDRARLGIMEPAPERAGVMEPARAQPAAGVSADVARAALGGFMPYEADPERQARYRRYLEQCAGGGQCAGGAEAAEFAQMARIFRPNAAMLGRFATAGSLADSDAAAPAPGARRAVVRTAREWAPHRLLCRRMGVPPPPNAVPPPDAAAERPRRMCAADFIRWDAPDSSGAPLVMADSADAAGPAADAPERPDMALFRSIFGE
ncbi:hypothetical protein H4R18_003716 [Coemansia javaensis]|uniref:G-patch domain-containing protein n=1 Tax=Coemansia javaensis TaxID=2761396 RepID=A0A9W8HDS5_9FUNG|nr:hypothetical protein H4R18_003716 [Coemansia javaensis]